MNTRVERILEEEVEKKDDLLREAGEILLRGGLVAFPTETVYGLGGDAKNEASSKKIYEAKGRPGDNPLIVHIEKFEDIEGIAKDIPSCAKLLSDRFWPGPLTMILKKSETVPYETTGGLETVAVRMPAQKVAAKLIRYGGGYVAAPSANRSGRPSPTLAKHVVEDLAGRVDMIIDGGEVGIGLESTIIDLTVTPPAILRPGFITKEMLEEVLGNVVGEQSTSNPKEAPKAPGMKYKHYAPKGQMILLEGADSVVLSAMKKLCEEASQERQRSGVLLLRWDESFPEKPEQWANCVKRIDGGEDPEVFAKNLYRVLREFDEDGVELIYSQTCERTGVGIAVMNRLLKAAGGRVRRV